MSISREDMLELTRRMNLGRNCFVRIAGAYLDEEGYIDGTFNTSFLKLRNSDQEKNLGIAKAVPFSKTNEELQEYQFTQCASRPESMYKLLYAMKDSELKNDAMLETFYERIGEKYCHQGTYAIYLFYGTYDVPLKGLDHTYLNESEEIYSFLVCAVCPTNGDYEAGEPEAGFLFPAFKHRSADTTRINIFDRNRSGQLEKIIL